MESNAARRLIKETLQAPFDKGRFTKLVANILNHPKPAPLNHTKQYSHAPFHASIKRMERIFSYKSPQGGRLDVLVVYLYKRSALERARATQRNYVAKYLKGARSGYKDGALVAFVAGDDSTDWRFSFVKMAYRFDEQSKVREEFSPARRYSFLVGSNENSHTAQSRLLPLLQNTAHDPELDELEDAFGVEQVTKEFFYKYRDLFLRLQRVLDEIIGTDAAVAAELRRAGVQSGDFAKKLLGQIVFLYFLQKKGWFGVQRGDEWGAGARGFLRELFDKRHSDYSNFFNGVLEPLFYEALRSYRTDDYYHNFKCRIPFLNGGLFDPIGDYNWTNPDIPLPDELFSNKNTTTEGDSGDGILDIFDRYNFTVKEDEPLEKEVAIDPEMLGKVFENLLEVKDRKSKGTYYTPREIVHYMCQQSLIDYLYGECNRDAATYETVGDRQMAMLGNEINRGQLDFTIEHHPHPPIGKEDIELFIRDGESIVEHDTRVVATGRETGTYSFRMPDSIRKNAARIDRLLADIRVCDPAIGSGAFPVGMMNEIVRSRNVLTSYLQAAPSAQTDDDSDDGGVRSTYHFKRHAIQSCLYGADIDAGAVEIAKLRLWLSLVVDEERRETIQPLPNLDYKIVQGNSLLGIERDLLNDEDFEHLEGLKRLYFAETSPERKQNFKREIDGLIGTIGRGGMHNTDEPVGERAYFDFRLYFSEVFHEKKGFDVVIGNPPYLSAVRNSKNDADLRALYRKRYPLVKGAFDIYVLFMIKGIEITNKKGLFTWIVPNKLLVAKYAEDVLNFLHRNGLYVVVNVSSIKVFESKVYPIIILGNKLRNDFNKYNVASLKDLEIKNFKKHFAFAKKYKTFKDMGIKVSSGATGFQAKELAKYIKEAPSQDSLPFVVSGSIDRFIINTKNVRYMKKTYSRAFIVKGKRVADSKWQFWNSEKIIIAGMTKRMEAAYSDKPLALGVGIYGIHNYSSYNPIFLLGLLNSKFISFYLRIRFNEKHLAGGYLAINKSTIEQLPIVSVTPQMQKAVSKIVDSILTIIKDDDYSNNTTKQAQVQEYERQIDQLVYQLYGLTEGEVEIVEGREI